MATQQKQPTIDIVGAGGCGINIISALQKLVPESDLVHYRAIDTSKSNLSKVDDVEIHLIGEQGSGKDRSKNLQAIQRYLDTHTDLCRETRDITIIISAFSGGTGGTVSNLLVQRILRHDEGKAVVVVGVVDTSTEKDCINSITTLRSFDKIAKDLSLSIPMLLLSNTIKVKDQPKPGRVNVNKTVVSRLNEFIQLMQSSDITEIDWMDKITYLRPQDSGCDCGLCSLSISATDFDATDNLPGEVNIKIGELNIVHSVMVVNDTGNTPDDLMANVSYVGVGAQPFISIMSEGIPPMLTQDLADTAEKYQHSVKLKSTMDSDLSKFGSEDKSGLIL